MEISQPRGGFFDRNSSMSQLIQRNKLFNSSLVFPAAKIAWSHTNLTVEINSKCNQETVKKRPWEKLPKEMARTGG